MLKTSILLDEVWLNFANMENHLIEAMIFGYSTDDRTLQVFKSEAEAISYAEGIDVEDGGWLFFNSYGTQLEAVFTTPNKKCLLTVVSGKYYLRPASEGASLVDLLIDVAAVEGPPRLSSVATIRDFLASNNSLKSDAAKPRTLGA